MQKNIPQIFWDKFQTVLSEDEFSEFQAACLRPLRKSIRVNTLKISVKDFQKKAEELGWELSPIPWCSTGFWIDRENRSEPLGKSYLHLAGCFYIQEASSMLPPEVLGLKEDEIVLDVAAAPGSKTTQMAAIMKNTGLILANEPETSRIKAIASNLERTGVANVLFSQKDGRAFSQYFPNFFDKILLDAPCGGEGTIRKDSHALEYWNEKRVDVMSKLQLDLAFHAFLALKPGGEMVYSTCTLSPEENEDIVASLLASFEGNAELIPLNESWMKAGENPYGLDGVIRVWPHTYDSEGFFVAKIKKNYPTEDSDFIDARRDSPFRHLSKGTLKWLNKKLQDMFGIEIENTPMFYERGNEIWIRPEKAEIVAQKMIIERGGMLFAERFKDDLKLSHQGALYLTQRGNVPQKGIVDIQQEDVKTFQQGVDLPYSYPEKQTVYIRYKDVFLGIGKSFGQKIKNQLPRYFVSS